MVIAGRTPRDYFLASRESFIFILVLSSVSVIGRLTGNFSVFVRYLPFAGLLIIGWAGWRTVRKYRFNTAQTSVVGFGLSFASHWTLPIFHSFAEASLLFVVNSIVFIAAILCGGFLAKKVTIT